MTPSKLALAALATTLLTAPVTAGFRRDDLGPRRRPQAAQVDRANADPGRPTLRVNGAVVDARTVDQALADGAFSWARLTEMFDESVILKEGLTREEYLVLADVAEPLAAKLNWLEQDEPHRRRAWEAYEKAKAGEDWVELVRVYSTEPGAQAKAGDLGVVAFDNLVHPFNRAMFSAPVGEVQPPVQTVFGWHVGKVTEVLAPRDIPRTDGTTLRRPETRRVSQILIIWDVGVNELGETSDVRLEVIDIAKRIKVEVLDRSRCDIFPHWCAAASIPVSTPSPAK